MSNSILTNEKAIEYIKTTSFFGLKDRQNTTNKYKNYKQEKFDSIIRKTHTENLNNNQKIDMFDNCERHLMENRRTAELIYRKDKGKKQIREISTRINQEMFQVLIDIVEPYCTNKNEERSFAIKLYLYKYDEINLIMKALLLRLICEEEMNY